MKLNSKPATKASILFSVIGTAIVFIVIGIGFLPPNVTVNDDLIRIRGLYGTSVSSSDVKGIYLIESNMREIGYGRRSNGLSSGNIKKGHFSDKLLFIQDNTSRPTIHIERANDKDIYISLSDGEKTRVLYDELSAAVR